MASISVRIGSENAWTKHQVKTMVTASRHDHQECSTIPEGEELFPIASITKLLVAAAVIIAIESESLQGTCEDAYARPRVAQDEALSKLYNLRSEVQMSALPGNPTIYDCLLHRKSLPSSNHLLLSPDGTPIMSLSQLREEVLRPISNRELLGTHANKSRSVYSNINYSAIAMTIEALWGGSFRDFMEETLFHPLKMTSTSIGFPADNASENHGWVVDSNGTAHPISRPKYRPDGAEAAALGAYSTVRDLDSFFKFIIDTYNGITVIEGVDRNIAKVLLQLQYEVTKKLIFCPVGLYTNLSSSYIGSISSNRHQFPDARFSTYPVLPSRLKKHNSIYYMAGTALGCTCATAFYPSEALFSVVVLTDTSGPVDTADHILRLILRRIVYLRGAHQLPRNFPGPGSVKLEVEQAMSQTLAQWRKIELEDAKLVGQAPSVDRDLLGVYKAVGFSQWLEITRKTDGKTYITVRGPSRTTTSIDFELVWIDKDHVKMCVRPHLCVDSLGDGDWSNLVLHVPGREKLVTELVRKTASGEDRFSRQA
jgi:hypothetical protein